MTIFNISRSLESPKWLFIWVLLFSLLLGFLILHSAYVLLGLMLLGLLTLIFVQKSEWALFLLLLLVPIDRFYFPVVYKLKFYQIVLIAAVFASLFSAALQGAKRYTFRWNLLDVAVALLLAGRLFSFFASVDHLSYAKSIMLHGLFTTLYFFIRCHSGSIEGGKLIRYAVSVGAVYVLFGFVEFLLGKLGYTSLRVSEKIFVYGGRPWSVFREPDWFGGYLTFIIGLTLPFAFFDSGERKGSAGNRWILYLSILMSLIIVVRSAWLGLMVGIAGAFVLFGRSRKILFLASVKMMSILFICLIVFLAVASPYFLSIQDRFLSIFSYFGQKEYDPATQTRINSFMIITHYIRQRPLQGYGAGAWEYLSQRHLYVNPSLSANNILLTPIFEMGIVGVVVYLIFAGALFKLMRRGIAAASSLEDVRYITGIVISVIGGVVVCIFNDIMLTGFYWAFLAIFNNYVDQIVQRVHHENFARST